MDFEEFLAASGDALRAALDAAYGPDAGGEATAEAIAWGWEHREQLAEMGNPAGYLFRVGQTAARRGRRRSGFLPAPAEREVSGFEPALIPALEGLSEMQRICVLMVHAFGYPLAEVARQLDVDVSTVRTHCTRALARLRGAIDPAPTVTGAKPEVRITHAN